MSLDGCEHLFLARIILFFIRKIKNFNCSFATKSNWGFKIKLSVFFQVKKRQYLLHYYSDKGFKLGIAVNRAGGNLLMVVLSLEMNFVYWW